jgi:E3 ubiquitin-protein ligase UBR4
MGFMFHLLFQVGYLPKLREVGSGVRCIPFMQVILMLSTDLDGNDDRDKASLDNLLSALVVQLDMQVKIPFCKVPFKL